MEALPDGIDSKFRYVLLVAKRAEQLIQGSSAKIKSRYSKPTRIAMDEVNRNQINWQLTEPVAEPADSGSEES
ncbi:MAG TPA: DNA-directed RNA polymerase subunit omega [Thermoanaerobaculia bacterium]|nr:DNA-directed RNA polymerase subunit omega [Thermoanaerobaculia bacterium]